jgi:hypothetical protein
MRTYEEIILENPNATFFVHNDTSVVFELDNCLLDCEEKPNVYVAIANLLSLNAKDLFENIEDQLVDYAYEDWALPYDDEDVKALQECIDKILLKHENYNTVYTIGEEINIDNLWKKIHNED